MSGWGGEKSSSNRVADVSVKTPATVPSKRIERSHQDISARMLQDDEGEPRCGELPVSATPRLPPPAGSPGADRLAARAGTYLNLRDATVTLVVGALVAGVAVVIPDPALRVVVWAGTALLVLVSLLVELPWLNRVRVRTTSYTVTPDFIYVVRGRLWRRSVLIATPQVLNVEIVQGPLLRSFGLVAMRFTCITETEWLGPLDPDSADRARATVLHSFAASDAR